VTGPIYVRGAAPGGTLEVHIEAVKAFPERGQAWTGIFAGFGALSADGFSIQEPLEPVTTLVGYDDQAATLTLTGRNARIPVRPFLGTVGVAPRYERRMSFSQSPEYLGDVDLPDLAPGATLVLPVHADGALLALGDAHAAQGDGEVTGAAIEIEAEVEIWCVPKDADEVGFTGLPQLNTASSIGSIAGLQGNDLTDCARAAYRDLVLRLNRHYGIAMREAYLLLGQVGRLRIGNMIDPFYSVLASIDRSYLP
jgi:amidase